MKQNILVFIALVIFASLMLVGGGCAKRITVKAADYVDKDKLRLSLIALCDECTRLVNDLDALLLKYAREARMNVGVINDKKQAAILAQEENRKYFVGPVIDLPIPRSEEEVQALNKKLKKAIDVWREADWLLTRPKKDLDYSNAYYFWLLKDLITRGLYSPSYDILRHTLIQDRIILRAHIGQMMVKLCYLLKEREELDSGKEPVEQK